MEEGVRLLQQQEPHSPFRPDEELHFDFPPVVLSPKEITPQESSYSHLPRAPVRKMISVPELRDGQRGPGLQSNSSMYRQNSAGRPSPRMRQSSEERGKDNMGVGPEMLSKQIHRRMMEQEQSWGSPDGSSGGRDRLLRQKSMERGIKVGLPPGHPQGRRGMNGQSRRGRRNGEPAESPTPGAAPPGLKMPLAFNSIARERGFTTGSPHPGTQVFASSSLRSGPPTPRGYPSNGPSSSAPDLFANNESKNYPPPRNDPRNPPRSHPYTPPQPPYSNNTSANTSPHSSFGPLSATDEVRTSFRSALSAAEENRSSTFTSSSELTEDSHAMTVDEAIGMYGSDTDEEILEHPTSEEESRRSKGDSVLGGATSRHGSVSDEGGARADSALGGVSRQASFADDREQARRSVGDSVLEGDVSPSVRSRMAEQENVRQMALEEQKEELEATHKTQTVEHTGAESGLKEDLESDSKRDEVSGYKDTIEPESSAQGNGQRSDHQEHQTSSAVELTPTEEALKILQSKPVAPEPKSPTFLAVGDPSDTPQRNPAMANGMLPKDARDRYGWATLFLTRKLNANLP